MLDATVSVNRDEFMVQIDLAVAAGEVLAIVGPNGSGKTTVVRAIAGLENLDAGRIQVNGHIWDDTDKSLNREPALRSTALVLADPLLFPHQSIKQNVAFGLRAHGETKADAQAAAAVWLERVGLSNYSERRPATLSTGQQQRVALIRALAVSPEVLLLDEPLSAQDPSMRAELRAELWRLLKDFDGVTVLVTHDALDALTLADSVIVMDKGQLVQQGTPAELVRRPANRFVAQLVGLNLLRGNASGREVKLEGGGTLHLAEEQTGPLRLAFAPQAVTVAAPSSPATSARNRWRATIRDLQPFYGRVRVTLDGPPVVVAEITNDAVTELALTVGDLVVASVKATEIEVYPG